VNETIDLLIRRKSVRGYQAKPVSREVKDQILEATLRAPTAGNLMLYSIIEVDSQAKKDVLAKSCDHQPFIAIAPWVLLFLADYQRWHDYFLTCDVPQFCLANRLVMRKPEEGDLMLAVCDALIAAQTCVVAGEALGLGSCYIGDIMEQYATHRALFDLPRYTFPIALLCLGYPNSAAQARVQNERFAREFIVFKNKYRYLQAPEYQAMFARQTESLSAGKAGIAGTTNVGQATYRRKFSADFALEMNRSVREILKNWQAD
jgi:nitroreductase